MEKLGHVKLTVCCTVRKRAMEESGSWILPFAVWYSTIWLDNITWSCSAHSRKIWSEYLDNILRHATKRIILSWAVPGQGGISHINNKPIEYVTKVRWETDLKEIQKKQWSYKSRQAYLGSKVILTFTLGTQMLWSDLKVDFTIGLFK